MKKVFDGCISLISLPMIPKIRENNVFNIIEMLNDDSSPYIEI